ncbi:MAG: SemiSWEET transporter [Candidatus Omnitrophota bacterium]
MQGVHIGLIGVVAGLCTTVSFLPQILKIVKTGQTRDISLWMYIILTSGILLWFVYGILIGEFPIIMSNCLSFVLCLYIVIRKFRNRRVEGK